MDFIIFELVIENQLRKCHGDSRQKKSEGWNSGKRGEGRL